MNFLVFFLVFQYRFKTVVLKIMFQTLYFVKNKSKDNTNQIVINVYIFHPYNKACYEYQIDIS